MKVCEICGDEIFTSDGDNRCNNDKCQNAPEVDLYSEPKPFTIGAVLKKKRKPRRMSAREEAMISCGLVKVRGALGGTYWE